MKCLSIMKRLVVAAVAAGALTGPVSAAHALTFNTTGDAGEWNFKEIYESANVIFPLPNDAQDRLKEFKEREEIKNYLIADSACLR